MVPHMKIHPVKISPDFPFQLRLHCTALEDYSHPFLEQLCAAFLSTQCFEIHVHQACRHDLKETPIYFKSWYMVSTFWLMMSNFMLTSLSAFIYHLLDHHLNLKFLSQWNCAYKRLKVSSFSKILAWVDKIFNLSISACLSLHSTLNLLTSTLRTYLVLSHFCSDQ